MSASVYSRHRPSEDTDAVLLVACGIALTTLVPVALHQVHALNHLPDPPLPLFDSDRITDSKQAHPFGVPDALLGLSSYGVTLMLAFFARQSPRRKVWGRAVPRLLGAKLLADGGVAGFNTVRQVVCFRKLCSWCMGTVLATAVMVYAGRRFIVQLLPDGIR